MKQVAAGVHIHESGWVQSNTVVIDGTDGVLLVDPGLLGDELDCLAKDLSASGRVVLAGFSTHPHWDHLVWHDRLGSAPRYGTALCAATARERLSGDVAAVAKAVGIPDRVPLDRLGDIQGLPDGSAEVPWNGPSAMVIEHAAYAPGHAALLVEDRYVLAVGDMLSDVLIPMLSPMADDPIEDYLVALELLEAVTANVKVVVPGHGSIAEAGEIQARIDRDRAYVNALRDGMPTADPRIHRPADDPWAWVADVHARQVEMIAAKRHAYEIDDADDSD
nr:MBL fold metallo-hydrolase [Planctomonas sp. JC2975]